MPLFYHKYVNYVLAHSVNYVITLYTSPLPYKYCEKLSDSLLLRFIVTLRNQDKQPHFTLTKCAINDLKSPHNDGMSNPLFIRSSAE